MNNREFKSHFGMGEAVYLLTDVDQSRYMITGINFTIAGGCTYTLSLGAAPVIYAYEQEISLEKSIV